MVVVGVVVVEMVVSQVCFTDSEFGSLTFFAIGNHIMLQVIMIITRVLKVTIIITSMLQIIILITSVLQIIMLITIMLQIIIMITRSCQSLTVRNCQ